MGLTTNTIPRTVALLNQIQDIDPCIGIVATNDTDIGDISVHAFHLTRDVLDDAIGQGGGVTGNVVLGLLVGPTHNGLSYRDWETDRKSTRLNSSHITRSRMPSSA